MRKTFQCLSLLLLFVLYFTTSAVSQSSVYTAAPGKQVITTSGGTFFDSGGGRGNYSDGESDTIVFYPSSKSAILKIAFNSFHTEADVDFLKIYYGDVVNDKYLMESFTGDYGQGITITAPWGGAPLTFVFVSDASTNDIGWDATITVEGVSTLPACPTLGAPYNNQTNVSLNPQFLWAPVASATSYKLIVDNDTIAINSNTGSYYYTNDTFEMGTVHTWKVLAIDSVGTSTGCPANQFTTYNVPACATYSYPKNDSTGLGLQTNIQWTANSATSYDIYVGTSENELVFQGNTYSTYFYPTLNYSTTYYWKIIPRNSYGEASGCSIARFTTMDKPQYLVLDDPNGGEVYKAGDTIKVKFTALSGSYYYVYAYLSYDSGLTYNNYLGYAYVSNPGQYTINGVIPANLSTSKCKIKVTYSDVVGWSDVSDSVFIINEIPKYFKFTSPVKGQFIRSNSSQYIYWASNFAGYINLHYSLDAGANWTLIASNVYNYSSETNSYYWYAPIVSGSKDSCLLKVSNAAGVEGVSSMFTISNQSPLVFGAVEDTIKPNSYHYFTVTNRSTSSQYNYLYYSTDGGSSWTYYTSYNFIVGTNQYSWYTPSSISVFDNCLLRIGYSEPLVYSEKFVIAPDPTITMSSPTDYTTLAWDEDYSIVFNTALVNNVNIEYSTDGGSSWNAIASNIAVNNGTNHYTWHTPLKTTYSSYVYVRISDAANSSINTIKYYYFSDKFFTISKPIGGETYKAGDTITLMYNSLYNYYNYVFISYDNGTNWTYLGAQYSSGDVTLSYLLPINAPTSNECRIKVSYYYQTTDPLYYDISEVFSTTKADAAIYSIERPYGGDYWKSGDQKYIQWQTIGIDSVDLYYSIDGGKIWNLISSSIACYDYDYSNTYSWTVPEIKGFYNGALIKIKDTKSEISQTSDTFVLTNEYPVIITNPKKGAKFQAGMSNKIEFTNRNQYIGNRIYLYASYNGGASWNSITSYSYLYSGNYTYSWYIPVDVASVNCRLAIGESLSNLSVSDSFVVDPVKPQISEVSSPGQNAYIRSGSNAEINWYSLTVAKVNILLSINGGVSWVDTVKGVTAVNGSNSYSWKVPEITGGISNNCMLRIENADSSALYAYSGTFAISNKDQLELLAPLAGTVINAGEIYDIAYKNNGLPAGYLYILYSNDSVNWSYSTYFYNSTTGSSVVNWSVDKNFRTDSSFYIAIANNTYLPYASLKVISKKLVLKGLPPQVTISSPLAGAYLTGKINTSIIWSSLHITYVNIDYSNNNGQSWNSIAKNTRSYDSEQNYYIWYVPSFAKLNDSCLIKVTDANDPKIADTSGLFTISPKSQLRVISPVLNDTVKAGSIIDINLYNYGQYINSAYLYYTVNNGSLNHIGNVYYINPGVKQYQWTIPANIQDGNNYRIVVSEANYNVKDTSAAFTIKGADPSIAITYPYMSTELWSNNNGYIYYNVVNVETVDILYSLDGGTKWDTLAKGIDAGSYYEWSVPVVLGTANNCLIKITGKSALGTTIEAISQKFTIRNEPVKYTINAPNGGETFKAGDKIDIQFTNSGKTSNAYVYYSLNEGAWNLLTTVYSYYGINYASWTIPVESKKSKARIKVVDYYNPLIADSSDNTFSIQMASPYINLETPSFNALWISNNQYIVGFNSLNVSDAIIEISLNGGLSYKSLDTVKGAAYGYNSKIITAPVVDTTITNAVLRVRSKTNSTVFASRSIVVSSSYPHLLVVSPNGGEKFNAGNYIPVKVNNLGGATYASVYISYNNGVNWNYVSNYYMRSGENSFSIYVDAYFTGSTQCLVKISPSNNETHSPDQSNAVFTVSKINPYIKVTYPIAGTAFWSGDNTEISWSSVHVESVKIEYSTDNKRNWNVAQLNLETENGYNTFEWTLPSITGKSDSCFIRISSDSIVGESGRFAINNEPSLISIVMPNGGEAYTAGNSINVQYSFYGRYREYCNIYLSTDSGKTRSLIGKDYSVNDGMNYFNYTIPKESKTFKHCFISVEEPQAENPVADRSNASFKINALPPYIKIAQPQQYDYIVSGKTYSVTWESYKVSKVIIKYSIDGGKSWKLLDSTKTAVSSINGNNEFSYIAPKIKGTFNNCYLKMVNAADTSYSVLSKVFTISDVQEGLKIISPNGGESFQAGGSYTISFAKTGPKKYTDVKLELSTDGGNSYSTIGWTYIYTENAEMQWKIDETLVGKNCKVRVSNDDFSDESDTFFEITSAPSKIYVTSPYTGINWQSGAKATISWRSVNVNKVNLLLTKDAGDSWDTIVSDVYSYYGTNYFTLEVDSLGKNEYNCKVKVVAVGDTNVFGVSPTFTIMSVPATIALTSPNGGEIYKSGSSAFINFGYTGAPALVEISISTDGGYNWTTLGSVIAKEGKNSFSWNVSQNPSTRCLIKVGSGELFDFGDSYFTLEDGYPNINITSPTAMSYYVSGSGVNIQWSGKNIANVNLEYSIDGGTNWITIANNYLASEKHYNWIVPVVETACLNALVRISNADDNNIYDISESFIMNNEAHKLTVVSPNGGDTLKANSEIIVEVKNNGAKSSASVILINESTEATEYLAYDKPISNGTTKFTVKIPAYAFGGEYYKLLVRDNNAYDISDKSDSFFRIIGVKPVIEIQSPDSGNVWTKFENRSIHWKSYNVDSVVLEYSFNDGKSWNIIDTLVEISGFYSSYSWLIPDVNAASKVAQVRISEYGNSKVFGLSQKFTLSGTPVSVTLLSHNGGQKIKAGTNDTIKFNYTGDNQELILYSSSDSGMNFNKVTTIYALHGYNEFILSVPYDVKLSDKYLFKIIDPSGATDTSNAVFSVVAADPTIKLNAPYAGDYWTSKSIQTINWFSWGISRVNIEYSIDGGESYSVIRNRVPSWNGSDNSFSITVPVVSGNKNARIRISGTTAKDVLSVSESFIITDVPAGFTFNTPAKDAQWQAGKTDTVKFEFSGESGNSTLYLSTDSGSSWNAVAYPYVALGTQSVLVTLPKSTDVTSNALFKIALNNDPSVSGISELFKVTAAPASIELVSPLENEFCVSGTIVPITWNSYSVKQVKIEYSIDNGATWKVINTAVSVSNGENSFNWEVANVSGVFKQSKIKVSSLDDSNVSSQSAVFTMANKLPSINNRLVELKVDGVVIANFNNETFEYEWYLPFSATDFPVLTAKAEDANASVEIENSYWFPGYCKVIVTAEDRVSVREFTINYVKSEASKDASLRSIKYNGMALVGFKPEVLTYKVELPFGTADVPSVEATASSKYAKVTVAQAEGVPGTAKVLVVAEDGVTTKEYIVEFTIKVDVQTLAGVEVEIYPNPVHERLYIKNAGDASIYLYNFTGQLVQTVSNVKDEAVIDVTSSAPGLYFIKIVKGKEEITRKVEILK